MSHVRKQVRDAVEALLAPIPEIGGRVFQHKVGPFKTVPAISINTPADTVIEDASTGTHTTRAISLVVGVLVKEQDAYMDQLDAIAAQVEARLQTDINLGGLAITTDYEGMTSADSEELENEAGAAFINFSVWVQTHRADPETVS